MAISFPNSPSVGQTLVVGNVTYTWDGTKWYTTIPNIPATITLSGDVSGSGTNSITTTLAGSGVTASTYTKITVDAKGRVTSGTTLAASDIPALTLENMPDAWVKRSVRAATTANITLSGTQTVDDIALVAGDRVLVKDQTAASQNGIYVVAAGAWSRAADANVSSEMAAAVVGVDSGTVNGGFNFDNDFKSTNTLDTTSMSWNRLVDTGLASSTSPAMNGTATIGTSISYARADHIHPTDTGRSPVAGSTSIVTVGTITSGTWNGSIINSTYGGTGVNNGGRTLTLNTNSGTLTFTNASTTLTVANTASVSGTNTGDQTITLTGDVTGTGTGSFATALAASGVTAGSYTNANITVDAKGRITAASNGSAGGGVTSFNTRTGAVTLTSSDVTTALTFTPYNSTNPSGYTSNTGTVTSIIAGTGLSGGTITTSGTLALANTTVTAGSYTNANITVDAQGRITAASNGSAGGGVTSLAAGTGISISASTGAVTVSIGQAVATSSNVQFNSLGVGTAGSATAGEIRATNNVTAYYASDIKFKENIQNIPNAVHAVSQIGGKLFDWTDAYIEERGGADGYFIQKQDFGVIAQDVKKAFPRAVRTRPDGSLAVDYEKLSALAMAAICEQQERIERLELLVQSLLTKN